MHSQNHATKQTQPRSEALLLHKYVTFDLTRSQRSCTIGVCTRGGAKEQGQYRCWKTSLCLGTATHWIDSRHLTAASVGVAMAGGVGRRSGRVLGHTHLRMTCTVLLAIEVDEGLDAGVLEEVVHCGEEVHKCV